MPSFTAPVRALVRAVSPRYAECLRVDQNVTVDVGAARAQHAGYVEALRGAGVDVVLLPAEDACPDCCFVEDTAVLTGRHALVTRPGAPSRRDEVSKVAEALAHTHRLQTMQAPATLDGGDVLRVGQTLFVGLSARTNAEGIARLGEAAKLDELTVVPLEVREGLHLKSSCTLATEKILVYDASALAPSAVLAFEGMGLSIVAADEPCGANVLALGDTCLVSAAAPRTAEALSRAGALVRLVDVSEFHKGDGALTCLSLRAAQVGAWCA